MAGQDTPDDGTNEIAAIVSAARERPPGRGRGARSGIYLWLTHRYAQLAPNLNPPAAPYWEGIAAALREKFPDVLDGDGKPPTADRVRKAWHSVRTEKQAEAAGQPIPRRRRSGEGEAPASKGPVSAPAPLAMPTSTPVTRQSAIPPAASIAPVEEDDTLGFLKFAKGRK